MIEARFVRDVSDLFKDEAHLFKMSQPVEWEDWTPDGLRTREADYVVASAAIVLFTGPETYLFPSDPNGEPISWCELPGSYRGGLSIKTAIENAGWKYVGPDKE